MTTRAQIINFKKRHTVLKEAIARGLKGRLDFSPEDVDSVADAILLAGSFKNADKSPHNHVHYKRETGKLVEIVITRTEAEELLAHLDTLAKKGALKRVRDRVRSAIQPTE